MPLSAKRATKATAIKACSITDTKISKNKMPTFEADDLFAYIPFNPIIVYFCNYMGVKIGNIDVGEFPLLLAPMEDVSDPPFRALCKEHGADVMYTEFISSEGLIRDADKSTMKLDIYDFERPIGIQIFGYDINSMRQAASYASAIWQKW